MGICNRCDKECSTIKYPNDKPLDWCEDCLADFLWIADYEPTEFKCWNCNNVCPVNHYIDEEDNHFCTKKCAVSYYVGLLEDF